MAEVERAYSAEDRARMAKNGQAMGDGSYPIANKQDLANAIRAVGRGSGSHNAIRRHIMKRAKALGAMDMIPETWMADGSMRSAVETLDGLERKLNELPDEEEMAVRSVNFARDYPVEDIRILSRANGAEYADGRTVEALVAVWDRGAEIVDGQGHYIETIGRSAFDKAIRDLAPQGSRSLWRVGVFYNHGMTLHGTPSDRGSVPIGRPIDIRADAAGLVTVTRYNETPLADEVLETIRAGDITGHSFSGRIIKSNPNRPPRGGFRPSSTGELTTVHRLELGLREYGPTPSPAYTDTAVLGVRAFLPTTQRFIDEDVERSEEPVDIDTSSDEEAVTDEPTAERSLEPDSDLARISVMQKIASARRTRPGLARSESEGS